MMISVEEAKKLHEQGHFVAGMSPIPDFVVSARTDDTTGDNIFIIKDLELLINKSLQLKNYTNGLIKHLTVTFIILPPYDGTGVNWQERKKYSRKYKKLSLELRTSYYDIFCRSTEKNILMAALAYELLRGCEKYLPKIKEIDYKKFHVDLITLFKEHKLLNEGYKNSKIV